MGQKLASALCLGNLMWLFYHCFPSSCNIVAVPNYLYSPFFLCLLCFDWLFYSNICVVSFCTWHLSVYTLKSPHTSWSGYVDVFCYSKLLMISDINVIYNLWETVCHGVSYVFWFCILQRIYELQLYLFCSMSTMY